MYSKILKSEQLRQTTNYNYWVPNHPGGTTNIQLISSPHCEHWEPHSHYQYQRSHGIQVDIQEVNCYVGYNSGNSRSYKK